MLEEVEVTQGYVYFLEVVSSRLIKIGYSTNVEKRLMQHRKGSLGVEIDFRELCRVMGTQSDEKYIHRYFNEYKVNGENELFEAADCLVDYIRWLRLTCWFSLNPGAGDNCSVDDIQRHGIRADEWMPTPDRRVAKPNNLLLFDSLHLPERETTGDDYYTNEKIIERARKVLGTIDLDPASHAVANRVVKAKRFFTIAQDGLRQQWGGNVWLNPPFSQWAKWIPKILMELRSDRITQMCVLCAMRTTTSQQFTDLLVSCDAIGITKGRIAFWGPRATGSPDDGHAVLYFGKDQDKFADLFRDIAIIFNRE